MTNHFKWILSLCALTAFMAIALSGCGWWGAGFDCGYDPDWTFTKLAGHSMDRYNIQEEYFEERKVHPYSQPEMQLTILSDSLVQLKYQRDGQEVLEVYRVTEKSPF